MAPNQKETSMRTFNVFAIALAMTACSGEYPDPEQSEHVNPYADVTIPPRDPAEELAQLQAEAPEGVTVELPPAGSMPAIIDVAYHADGTRTRTHYNGDGTPWVDQRPPGEVEKAAQSCQWGVCPCDITPWAGQTPDSDVYGNDVYEQGICMVPDNAHQSWEAVDTHWRWHPLYGSAIPGEYVIDSWAGWNPGVRQQLQYDTILPAYYSSGWVAPYPTAFHGHSAPWLSPRGWMDAPYGSATKPFPTMGINYPQAIDAVVRRETIVGKGSYYDNRSPADAADVLAINRYFLKSFNASMTNGVPNYGTPAIYTWRPTSWNWIGHAGNPLVKYVIVYANTITIDEAKINAAAGGESWKQKSLMQQQICHERGHAMGVGHLSGEAQHVGCMARYSEYWDDSKPGVWSHVYDNQSWVALTAAVSNPIPQYCNPLCGTGGTGLHDDTCMTCYGATRPPIGTTEY